MKLRIAIAQLDLQVGDVAGNAQRVIEAACQARDEMHAQAIVFPEMTLAGYSPEDLLFRRDFLNSIEAALAQVTEQVQGIDVIIGFPQRADGHLYNCAAVLREGTVHALYRKHNLPNYGVFDEKRYFTAGEQACVFELHGVSIGLTICEDIWQSGIVEQSAQQGAKLILNLNASPFRAAKCHEREAIVAERIAVAQVPVLYVNLVGGQDELVFDGASFVMAADQSITFRAPEFEESVSLVEFDCGDTVIPVQGELAPHYSEVASEYKAIVTGIRDYTRKNGFKGVLLGLSGGIDSALTLALAVDALGSEQVEVVLMPSRYTADMSNEDAITQAETLKVKHHTIPIKPAFDAFTEMLQPIFTGLQADATEENIQARCRGILLMALSNKTGKLLLTTGNKSEMSVGYATLYGDMAGGFAPIKDVPKLLVYEMAEHRNQLSPVIPQRVIDRPPSAELAPDQQDSDSLPPYSVLDAILALYIEEDCSADEIMTAGYTRADVMRVTTLVDRNEYKRRQAPPGVRITPRAFGRDRRYPISNGFRQIG